MMRKASNTTLFFHRRDQLITIKQSDQHRAIFRNEEHLLAELSTDGLKASGLLATDQMGSVLGVQESDEQV